jgi:hypothetical protein
VTAFTPPVREDLAGVQAYGAPQLAVRARLNVNEHRSRRQRAGCTAIPIATRWTFEQHWRRTSMVSRVLT